MKSEPMDEDLIGYLLGALDPVTHRHVEAHVRTHPEARARLDLLEQALAPLAEDAAPPAPPPGLAAAAIARVAAYRAAELPPAVAWAPGRLPPAPEPSRHQVGSPGRGWGRRGDWAVAALLLVLLGGLTAPMLVGRWHDYRRTACENNLRLFWGDLQAYADRGAGDLPRVEADGPRAVAGIFVPVLNDAGVLGEASVTCPGEGRPGAPRSASRRSVRELEELHRSDPAGYQAVARELAGGYAYCLGYREGSLHRGLRRGPDDDLPVLADRPQDGGGNSLNHGGGGQNVLYVGGNVRWCVHPGVGPGGDDIYLNQDFQVRAGLHRADSVLGGSDTRP
jgi:hypothetical protein